MDTEAVCCLSDKSASLKTATSLASSSFKQDDTIYRVSFSPRDCRNPIHFPKSKKWLITIVTSVFTLLVSASATSFNMGTMSMINELHCTNFQATLGLSLYCLGFGVAPLFTSSFSEEFGRLPLYYISLAGFLSMHLMAAMSKNVQMVVVSRFMQGTFGSTGATMVAGTLTDIWVPAQRGLPMSMYSFLAFAGNGAGALVGGWVEQNPNLQWRWIQWISLIIGGVYFVVMILALDETRSSVILESMAEELRRTSGDLRYWSALKKGRSSLKEKIYVSCTRPMLLLLCEPIVTAVSVWIGFAWGVYYCMIASIPGVFQALHGFNHGQIGSVYMTMALAGMIGLFTNMYQERLYQKNFVKRGAQARLYLAGVAGFLFPLSMFMFAWSSTPQVPWPVLVIALVIYIWAVFTIYLCIFTYLADCYGTYASSALAGQSLCRNLMATIFPLFADRMFRVLGYRWANTLFAFAGLIMSPIPIVLFFFGPRILAKSKIVGNLSGQTTDSLEKSTCTSSSMSVTDIKQPNGFVTEVNAINPPR